MTDHRRAHVLTGGGTGAVDKIDGAGLAAGDTIQCINSAGIYHYVNVQDSAAEDSPYVIRPDTNPGTNSWHLVTPQGPMSYVFANTTAGQTIPTGTVTKTTVIFDNEIKDRLGEYDHTTGVFTATYAGTYIISSVITYDSAIAWADDSLYGYIERSIGELVSVFLQTPTDTQRLGLPPICATLELAAGETVEISLFQNSGSGKNLQNLSVWNWLTIARIM